jgi:hypothetical protein
MLVDRRTFIVKKGHWDEAIGLLRELKQKAGEVSAGAMRIYSSMIGPFDTIAYEWEIAGLDAWQHALSAYMTANAEWEAAWMTRWNTVTEPGGALEIWRIEE